MSKGLRTKAKRLRNASKVSNLTKPKPKWKCSSTPLLSYVIMKLAILSLRRSKSWVLIVTRGVSLCRQRHNFLPFLFCPSALTPSELLRLPSRARLMIESSNRKAMLCIYINIFLLRLSPTYCSWDHELACTTCWRSCWLTTLEVLRLITAENKKKIY